MQYAYRFAVRAAGLALMLLIIGSEAAQLTYAAGGTDDDNEPATADDAHHQALQTAQDALKRAHYEQAIEILQNLSQQNNSPSNRTQADVFNLLGYSHRKLQRYDQALDYYQRALALDPEHRGAHEYLGELYLQTEQPLKAEQQLAALSKSCRECDEYRQLKRAIAAYYRPKHIETPESADSQASGSTW